MSHSSWLRRSVLLLGLVLGMLATTVGAVGAQPGQPAIPYLALGDSVPYGWDVLTTPLGPGADPSSHVGFPEVFADRSPFEVTNASCPGETSGHLISLVIEDNGCDAVRGFAGIKVDWGTGSQLDFALDFLGDHPDTGLVTLMVGANDLFICQRLIGCDTPEEVGAVLAQVGANVATIVGALRTAYDGPIVLVAYYSLDYRDPAQVALGMASMSVLDQVAGVFDDVLVADGFGAFALASLRSGGDPCAAGLLLPLSGGGCDVHTTPRGDRVLAQAVHRAIHVGAIVSGVRS